jgi:hypothetical protein
MEPYSVPDFCLALNLGSYCSPGYFGDATWIKRRFVQSFRMWNDPDRFSVFVLNQADNPRRLVSHYDDSDVSSCAYSYSTVLDGIPRWIRSYHLSFPLHGLMVSRYRGECASPLHLGERNCTSTEIKLSKTILASVPNP